MKTLFTFVIILALSLVFSVDGYAKGGGKGGGRGGGRGFTSGRGSHGVGHSGHHITGFFLFSGGFISRGYGFGYPGSGGSSRSGCLKCHPSLKWSEGFRSCPYEELNRMKSIEDKGMAGSHTPRDEWPGETFK